MSDRTVTESQELQPSRGHGARGHGGGNRGPAESSGTEAAYERTWETRRRGRSAGDAARDSYYSQPVIHRPHWKWQIWLYFFFGGLAGGSYVVAAVARLLGDPDARRIARVGTYLSFAAMLPCPVLLILDLKRPTRFLNMLRVLKLRSPMSVGTWGLVAFSGFSTLSAAAQVAQDGLLGKSLLACLLRVIPGRAVAVLGAGPALFLGGYTGVLLAATAVPLWTKRHLLMGPIFLSSALSNATAAIALLLALGGHRPGQALRRLERLDVVALLAELVLMQVFERTLGPTIARPLREGRLGRLHRWGTVGAGLLVPLLLQGRSVLRGSEPSRPAATLASLLVLAGGLLFRYVIVTAGKVSADDPLATFDLTGEAPDSR